MSMITIGSLARVIVSGNHRFRSCLRKLLLSLGPYARIGAPPLFAKVAVESGRTTEIRRVRAR